jgi:hypothetical protein
MTLVIFGEFIALTASYCGLKVVLHGQTATRESDSSPKITSVNCRVINIRHEVNINEQP